MSHKKEIFLCQKIRAQAARDIVEDGYISPIISNTGTLASARWARNANELTDESDLRLRMLLREKKSMLGKKIA